MPPGRLNALLGAALALPRRDARPDEELLALFLDRRDEFAFEALLLRHTPAVRAACRVWLRSSADIDDATQATFLVLVQRARSIRQRAALGGWLYRVAANVARRLKRQQRPACSLPEDVPGREPADDGRDLVAEEVARLPEKYRLPVQLCYLVGLTTAEAAGRLGWPKGTVLTRLAWARRRLRASLTRRGLAPAALAGLAAVAPAGAAWTRQTVRAARGMLAGASSDSLGMSERTISLTEGVVRAMVIDRLKYVVLATLMAVGLIGFGLGHWATASDGPNSGRRSAADDSDPRAPARVALPGKDKDGPPPPAPEVKDDARPAAPGRRRETVIRLPVGSFVKEIDGGAYGSGRITWTYEEERVVGLVEGSVMGFEFELGTEAEYALSSNGTIYGLLTGVRVNHLKVPEGKEEFAELKPFAGLWSVVEPLVNEVLVDLPFSYKFRVQGDRLVISNFRILLAGPNPLGKVGGLLAHDAHEMLAPLAYFQALGTALEGTYTAPDGKEQPAPVNKRRLFLKPGGNTKPKG